MAATADRAPSETAFLTLDADREAVPSDWYLRLAGETQRVLRARLWRKASCRLRCGAATEAAAERTRSSDLW